MIAVVSLCFAVLNREPESANFPVKNLCFGPFFSPTELILRLLINLDSDMTYIH